MPVSKGGTGVNQFTGNSVIMSGSSATSALTTRALKNLTAKGNLGWTSASVDNTIVTTNTMAYWDGRYNSTSSNLTYCVKGAFGNLAIKDSLAASDIPSLAASKITSGTFDNARISTSAGTSTLAWNTEVTLGTVAGLAIKAKLPAQPANTDTLVKQTVKTDNVNYKLLATTSASPTSASAMEATYSANIFANPSTGALSAPQHMLNVNGSNKAYMQYNSTDECIDFIFV